ncbi:MAG: TIGR01459 family HAD-type hydrolase [Rhodobacteraceae bacterium]|nr:TIGR01459 family HAD-type hydrolase [Paracoccaceae bacterium]
MVRVIQNLAEISQDYDVLYCDLWGCLHNGAVPYPAAVAALQSFRAGGGTVVLMTNAPRPSAYVRAQLDRLGVPRDAWDMIVSSGDAAQAALFTGAVGRRVYHLGPDKDLGFFEDVPDAFRSEPPIARVPLAEAEGIVCTGPFEELTETPEDYRATFLYAKAKGLRLLCTNPDQIVDFGDRRIYCAGALARLYDEMGGESLYFGKPYPPIYDLARRRLGEAAHDPDPSRILAVGDGIATDIRGGLGEGIDTLFVTGGLAADEFGRDVEAPDAALLADWLARQETGTTFAIGRLR